MAKNIINLLEDLPDDLKEWLDIGGEINYEELGNINMIFESVFST